MLCRYCKIDKPETSFEIANVVNGKVYRRRKCKLCKQHTQNQRRSSIAQWFKNYTDSWPCVKCGNTDNRVRQFHHRDPAIKKLEISRMLTYSTASIIAELNKCDSMCANCHAILHYEERNFNGI